MVSLLGPALMTLAPLGCVTDLVDPAQLPDEQIAVLLWDSESARQRRDLMADLAGESGQNRRQGVVDLGALSPRASALATTGGAPNPALDRRTRQTPPIQAQSRPQRIRCIRRSASSSI